MPTSNIDSAKNSTPMETGQTRLGEAIQEEPSLERVKAYARDIVVHGDDHHADQAQADQGNGRNPTHASLLIEGEGRLDQQGELKELLQSIELVLFLTLFDVRLLPAAVPFSPA
jgi:hypothetical protein